MVQSLAAPAFAGTAEKKWVVVDYYLTTICKTPGVVAAQWLRAFPPKAVKIVQIY